MEYILNLEYLEDEIQAFEFDKEELEAQFDKLELELTDVEHKLHKLYELRAAVINKGFPVDKV